MLQMEKAADGKALCGRVTQPGDIAGKPEPAEAWPLGRSIQ